MALLYLRRQSITDQSGLHRQSRLFYGIELHPLTQLSTRRHRAKEELEEMEELEAEESKEKSEEE